MSNFGKDPTWSDHHMGERQRISSRKNLLELFDKERKKRDIPKFRKKIIVFADTTRCLALHVDYCYYH